MTRALFFVGTASRRTEFDMKRTHGVRMTWATALLFAICETTTVDAQIGVGTWVKQASSSTQGTMTLTVEACCGEGRRLTYHFANINMVMVIESAFDGSEAPVLVDGKPSGETMAITRVDATHTSTIIKFNGQLLGTSKASLSADGKTLSVVNDMSSSVGGNIAGKTTEAWIRQ